MAASVMPERKLSNFQGIVASKERLGKEQREANLTSDFKKEQV